MRKLTVSKTSGPISLGELSRVVNELEEKRKDGERQGFVNFEVLFDDDSALCLRYSRPETKEEAAKRMKAIKDYKYRRILELGRRTKKIEEE